MFTNIFIILLLYIQKVSLLFKYSRNVQLRLMFNTSCCLSSGLTFQIACKVVAMVLHYFFLSSFTWMMVEGIALYFSCTRGLYNHGDMRMKYCFVGWGIPLVIVVISIGAEFPHYGNSERNR